MRRRPLMPFLILVALLMATAATALADSQPPLGEPGLKAEYTIVREGALPAAVVRSFQVQLGRVESQAGKACQWLRLQATLMNREQLAVWLLTERYPAESLAEAAPDCVRYLLQEGTSEPLEFRHRFTGKPVLPVLGAWKHLFPHAVRTAEQKNSRDESLPPLVELLGHRYRRMALEHATAIAEPPAAGVLQLLPDVLIGVPHNTRQADETRRYDGSDYTLVPLTQSDYAQAIEAGMNCLFVERAELPWVENRDVFYWGVGGADVRYPSCLYRSNYLGLALFIDEPAVHTRDLVIRPQLAKEPSLRKGLSPQEMFVAFQGEFRKAKYEGAAQSLLRGLAARSDVALGTMDFLQANLYSWETMISSSAFQLTEGGSAPPSFLVFEPPGFVGTRKTLPEMDMVYGCQIPTDDPNHLASILNGFLRGAARASQRGWGTSIYGAVDRADTFGQFTHAYDLGAVGFFFWDCAQSACVPWSECLALARHLRAHAERYPERNLERLRNAAEIAVLLPPGYDLGHVHMGRGLLWGLGELNLERHNAQGVAYRTVMHHAFTEIERALRLGVAFDVVWDLPGLTLSGYREVVRIREDGKVEVTSADHTTLLDGPRPPQRPEGQPPTLALELSPEEGSAPATISARACVVEGSAPVYYTTGTNDQGICWNTAVLWELFGPEDEDYRSLPPRGTPPRVADDATTSHVTCEFRLDRPGTYRLRAATVDTAGRTAVVWKTITVRP